MRTVVLLAVGFALGCGQDTTRSADAGSASDAPTAQPDAGCALEDTQTFYADLDADGYGDPNFITVNCTAPAGFVENQLDCNDDDPRDNPDGTELCDGIDNDCNAATGEVCPNQCSPRLNSSASYLFCRDRLEHEVAAVVCSGQDMHLVRIDEAEEQSWLSTTRVAAFGSNVEAWLGGSDAVVEDTWLWADETPFWEGRAGGVPVGGAFTFWRAGEPNNSEGEDCLAFATGSSGRWDDRDCNSDFRFICERNTPPQ